MKIENLKALLHLTRVPKLGPMRIRSLIRQFKSPQNVFHASVSELCKVERIDIKIVDRIKSYLFDNFAEIQIALADKYNTEIITFWDEDYPVLLKKIYDPPVILFVKGNLIKRDFDSLAIVGTRNPTSYGVNITKKLSNGLAQAGITIVSGFAKGIDSVAHRSALSVGGRTVAVLGNGLDIIYPFENRPLVQEFKEDGVFISEFPFGTKPDAGNFPQRNRIISGLSLGTIVIEAGNRSGAILTAINAVDQNREVFSVPGRLTDKKSVGCLRLIRHGAIPVESVDQILETVKNRLRHPPTPVQGEMKLDLTKEEMSLYEIITDEPKHIDDILQVTKLDPSSALTILLSMELKGVISQLSGKNFVRNF